MLLLLLTLETDEKMLLDILLLQVRLDARRLERAARQRRAHDQTRASSDWRRPRTDDDHVTIAAIKFDIVVRAHSDLIRRQRVRQHRRKVVRRGAQRGDDARTHKSRQRGGNDLGAIDEHQARRSAAHSTIDLADTDSMTPAIFSFFPLTSSCTARPTNASRFSSWRQRPPIAPRAPVAAPTTDSSNRAVESTRRRPGARGRCDRLV
jgi:hypothetical protein